MADDQLDTGKKKDFTSIKNEHLDVKPNCPYADRSVGAEQCCMFSECPYKQMTGKIMQIAKGNSCSIGDFEELVIKPGTPLEDMARDPKRCDRVIALAHLEYGQFGLMEKGQVIYELKMKMPECAKCGFYTEKKGKKLCLVYREANKDVKKG